jgi:hypothetical protein
MRCHVRGGLGDAGDRPPYTSLFANGTDKDHFGTKSTSQVI